MIRKLAYAFALVLAGLSVADAATLKTLHTFCAKASCRDGQEPGWLFMDSAGNLFGVTFAGGTHDVGVVYELKANAKRTRWGFRVLYNFCSQQGCADGCRPFGGLIADTGGNLYGTAPCGGASGGGVVFKLTPAPSGANGTLEVLHAFCSSQKCADGSNPSMALTYQGAQSGAPYDGAAPLYGIASFGGTNDGGVIYEIDSVAGRTARSETVLYNFANIYPTGPLLPDGAGNLYGTTGSDGAGKRGTIFRLSPGNLSTLYSFCTSGNCSDGRQPFDLALTGDSFGTLFGVTNHGGTTDKGVVFSLAGGTETVLHDFCPQSPCQDGAHPMGGVTLAPDGTLYGATQDGGKPNGRGDGAIFSIDPAGAYHVLYSFCSLANCADGSGAVGKLALDGDGRLFGTTPGAGDGTPQDPGTVFMFTP